jgi:hypothetical protein
MSRLLPILELAGKIPVSVVYPELFGCRLVAGRNRSELIGTASSSLPTFFSILYSIETLLNRFGRVLMWTSIISLNIVLVGVYSACKVTHRQIVDAEHHLQTWYSSLSQEILEFACKP